MIDPEDPTRGEDFAPWPAPPEEHWREITEDWSDSFDDRDSADWDDHYNPW